MEAARMASRPGAAASRYVWMNVRAREAASSPSNTGSLSDTPGPTARSSVRIWRRGGGVAAGLLSSSTATSGGGPAARAGVTGATGSGTTACVGVAATNPALADPNAACTGDRRPPIFDIDLASGFAGAAAAAADDDDAVSDTDARGVVDVLVRGVGAGSIAATGGVDAAAPSATAVAAGAGGAATVVRSAAAEESGRGSGDTIAGSTGRDAGRSSAVKSVPPVPADDDAPAASTRCTAASPGDGIHDSSSPPSGGDCNNREELTGRIGWPPEGARRGCGKVVCSASTSSTTTASASSSSDSCAATAAAGNGAGVGAGAGAGVGANASGGT